MGLYDNYRLSNSTGIPQFAGSMLPELNQAKKELDERYDFALANATNTGNAMNEAPVYSGDQQEYGKVYGEINDQLKSIAQRKDYENMVPQTQKLAAYAAQRLKPFVASQARYQAALQKLDDKELGLDANTKAGLMEMMIDEDKNRKNRWTVNPVTGQMEGGFNAGTNFAKNVDLTERVKKYVGDAVARKTGSSGSWTDGKYIYHKNGERVLLTPEEIHTYVQEGLKLDPEAKAFIQQQANLSGWRAGKNASTYLKKLPDSDKSKQDIAALVSQGTSPKDAVRQVATRDSANDLLASMMGFSNKYQHNDYSPDITMSSNPYGVQQAGWDHDAKQQSEYMAQGTTEINDPEIQTADGLHHATENASAAVQDYSNQIGDAQLRLTTKGDKLTLPEKAKLVTDINTWTAAMKANQDKVAQYQQIKEQNLDDAASGLFHMSYKDVLAAEKGTLLNAFKTSDKETFKAASQFTSKGWSPEHKTFAKKDVLKQIENGEARLSPDSQFLLLKDGTPITLKGSLLGGGSSILSQVKDAQARSQRVIDYANKNYKPVGFVTNTGVIPEKDWKDGIVPLLPQMKATDADGNVVDLSDKGVDWEKTPRSVFNVDGNHIPVTLVDHSGKEVGTYKLDASSTNVRNVLGKKFYQNGSTPEIRNLGEDMLTEMPQIVREAFPRNTYSTTARNGKPYILDIDGTEKQVQLMRRADNLFVISDMNGKELKRTASHSQAGRWLRALEQGAK